MKKLFESNLFGLVLVSSALFVFNQAHALDIYCDFDPETSISNCQSGGGGGGPISGSTEEYGELIIDAPNVVGSGEQFQVDAIYDPGYPYGGILDFNDLTNYVTTLIDGESSWTASRGEHVEIKPVFKFSDSVTQINSEGSQIGTTTLANFLDDFDIGETQIAEFTTDAAVFDEYTNSEGEQYVCGDYGIVPPTYNDLDDPNSYNTIPASSATRNFYRYPRTYQTHGQALRDWTLQAPENNTGSIQYYRLGVDVDHRYRHTQYNCEYFLRWTGIQDGNTPSPAEQGVRALPMSGTFDIAVLPESPTTPSNWSLNVTARRQPASGTPWQSDELTVDANTSNNVRVRWDSSRTNPNGPASDLPYTCTANYDANNLGTGLSANVAGENYFALEDTKTFTVTCVDDNDPTIYLSDSVTVIVNPYDVEFIVETSVDGTNWSNDYNLTTSKNVTDLYIKWDTNQMSSCVGSWGGSELSLDGTYRDQVTTNNVAGAQSYNITCEGRDGNTYSQKITHDRFTDESETVSLASAADYTMDIDFEVCDLDDNDEPVNCSEEVENDNMGRIEIQVEDTDDSNGNGVLDEEGLTSVLPSDSGIRSIGTENGNLVLPWLTEADTVTFTVVETPEDPEDPNRYRYDSLHSPDGTTTSNHQISCTIDQLFNNQRCGQRQATSMLNGWWEIVVPNQVNAQVSRNSYANLVARFVRSGTNLRSCEFDHFTADGQANIAASPGQEITLSWEVINDQDGLVQGSQQLSGDRYDIGNEKYIVQSINPNVLRLTCAGSNGVNNTAEVTIGLQPSGAGDSFELDVDPVTTSIPGVTGAVKDQLVITITPQGNYAGRLNIDVDTGGFGDNLAWEVDSNPINVNPGITTQTIIDLTLTDRVSRGPRTVVVTATDTNDNTVRQSINVNIEALNLIDGIVTEQ